MITSIPIILLMMQLTGLEVVLSVITSIQVEEVIKGSYSLEVVLSVITSRPPKL